MPTYDYVCSACGHRLEVVHGIHGHGPERCPVCGGAMRKAFVAPAVHFKGSGWAKKDRGAAKTTKAAAKSESAEGGSAASGGSEGSAAAAPSGGSEGSAAGGSEGTSRSGSGSVAARAARLRRAGTTDVAGSAADWITLAEAVEVLEAANVHFKAATIGGWARSGKLQSIKLGGRRYVKRGQVRALVTAPRSVRADRLQPGLFEDWTG